MKRKPYRYLFYLGLRSLQGVVPWIPRRVSLGVSEIMGRLAFFLARRERKRTLVHLSRAFDQDENSETIRELARRVFIHFARVGVDVLRFPRLSREELERLVEKRRNLEILDTALAEGRGAILLTAHLGNWELMGAFLRFRGYQGAVVGRRLYYEGFNQVILDLRKKVDLQTIYQDASPKEFFKVLRRNEILGILADQDIDRLEGIFVPFFGRPTYTLTAPARLALAAGAPIVPAFLVREDERYQLLVEEPIRVEWKGSREETIRDLTVRWSQVIEEKIRAYPDQWAWMHRRWKTQPAGQAVPMEVS